MHFYPTPMLYAQRWRMTFRYSDLPIATSFIAPGMEKRAVLEFSRDRKSMSVLWHEGSSGSNVLFAKGAPEMLIKRCSKIMMPDGQIEPLTDAWRTQIEKELLKMLGSNNVDIQRLLNSENYHEILKINLCLSYLSVLVVSCQFNREGHETACT